MSSWCVSFRFALLGIVREMWLHGARGVRRLLTVFHRVRGTIVQQVLSRPAPFLCSMTARFAEVEGIITETKERYGVDDS